MRNRVSSLRQVGCESGLRLGNALQSYTQELTAREVPTSLYWQVAYSRLFCVLSEKPVLLDVIVKSF